MTRKKSVELPYKSDRPVAETSTWQHTTLTREKHLSPVEIRTRNPSKQTAADLRLRTRGHRDRLRTIPEVWYSDGCVVENL